MGNSLKKLRTARGWTQDQAAEAFGMSRGGYIKLEQGERLLTQLRMEQAAKLFGVGLDQVLAGDDDRGGSRPKVVGDVKEVSGSIVAVPVIGVVEAGAFREANEFAPRGITYHPRDRAFPDARLIAYDVQGDSMNALTPTPILAGARLVCLDFESLKNQLPLRNGMVVVVERVSFGGQLREVSVKQIEMTETEVRFMPRSTNPHNKPIIVRRDLHADDGVTVSVVGIVRGVSYSLDSF